jgi:hypothetical protein
MKPTSYRERTRDGPMDWAVESRQQACRKVPAVYSAAPIGVQDDAGHDAAALPRPSPAPHRRCRAS